MNKILIIGPGAYGLCLSEILHNNSENEISLLGTSLERLNQIQNNNFELFGKHIKSVSNIYIDYKECFKTKYDLIIFAVPSNNLVDLLNEITNYIDYDVNVINTCKGMKSENEYWCTFFAKINKHFNYSFLTGPSFAQEIINKEFTVCNLCTKKRNTFKEIDKIFKCNYFKLIHLKEIKVYEFVSCLKNAIALSFGIINALTESQNTINALFARIMFELNEILKIKFKLSNFDLFSYCSLGDILMCSTSTKSRNYCYGYDFIKLDKNELKIKYENSTIEGIKTLFFLKDFFKKHNCKKFLLNKFSELTDDNKISLNELIFYFNKLA